MTNEEQQGIIKNLTTALDEVSNLSKTLRDERDIAKLEFKEISHDLSDARNRIWQLEKQIEGLNNFANERFDEIQKVRKERDDARGALHNYQCDAVAWEILTKAKHERDRLREVVIQTLNANRHLADGDNCTLAILKSAVPEWK
jgi:chromosome segregation ATPase